MVDPLDFVKLVGGGSSISSELVCRVKMADGLKRDFSPQEGRSINHVKDIVDEGFL